MQPLGTQAPGVEIDVVTMLTKKFKQYLTQNLIANSELSVGLCPEALQSGVVAALQLA